MTTTLRVFWAILATVVSLVVAFSIVPAAAAQTVTTSISGTVSLDSAGHPATNGKVSVDYQSAAGGGETIGAYVSSNGSFTIAGLTPGQYSFRLHDDSGVYEDGFPLASLNGSMSPVRPTTPEWITIAAGQSLSFGELIMTPWGVASGHITVHGQPGSSNGERTWTDVELSYQLPGSTEWTPSGSGRTDADGNYRVTTVPRALGGLSVGRYRLIAEPINTDQTATLIADDISSSMDIDLPFVTRVSGTVSSGYSPTVANEVNLTLTNGSTTLTATTDSNGTYLFNDVPNGAWQLSAAYASGTGTSFTTTVVLSSTAIDIPTTTVPPITLAALSSFSGHVIASNGAQLAGIDMTAAELDPDSGDFVKTFATTTDAQGAYAFLDLPAGSYEFLARDPAQNYATMEYDNESPYYGPDYVQSVVGMTSGLDFSMPVAAHIQGTVHGPPSADFADGDVSAEVEVEDYSTGGPVWFETGDIWPVGADGTYDVGDLPPDDYRLKFSDSGAAIYAPVTTAPVTAAEGQTFQHVDVTMSPTVLGGFVSLAPSRLVDTRSGVGVAAGAVAPGGVLTLQVAGAGGVPASGVSAVVLNVTVTSPSSFGYLTAYGDGTTRPTASNLNFVPAQTVPNLVIAPVGADGKVDLYNGSAGTVQIIADVAGFSVSGTPTASGAFGSLSPSRLLDTRSGVGAAAGAVESGGVVTLQVDGRGGVPTSGVSAVVLNVTVTAPSSFGFLTVYGDGTTRPTASNLNFVANQTVPNLVVAPVGPDGEVDLYNGSAGTIQVIADVAGYYLSGDPTAAGAFGALVPSRLLDTRIGTGAPATPIAAGGTVSLQVAGRGGVPTSGVSSVVLNVTVIAPSSFGYLTAYGDGTFRPTASNLNFTAGQTVPNMVVAPVGDDGKVDLYNGSTGTVQVVADVEGYYLTG